MLLLPGRARGGLGALLRRIEAMNLRGARQHWSRIPPELVPRLRPRVVRIGDGLLTLLGESDSLRMNRVMGLGHRGRAEERMIDEIIATYRAAGRRRFSLKLGPGPQTDAIAGWLRARGFEPHGGYSLLVRDCRRPVTRRRSRLRVTRIGARRWGSALRITERCFGMAESRRPWARASMAAPCYEQYLARAGTTPVAAGTLWVERDLAWLGGGATLPRWRGRGAHGAVIAARLARAARRGCRWAWVETDAPARGRPGGSRRNLLRHGFEEAWVSPIFMWREPGAADARRRSRR